MDPNTNNPGASAPPQPQDDLGQTRYFPPVGQPGQAGAQVPQVPPASQPQGAPAAPAPVAQAAPTYQGNGYAQGPTAPPYQAQPQPQPLPQPQQGYGYNPQAGTNGQAGPAPQHSSIWLGQHDQHRAIWGLVLVGAGVLFLVDQLFSFSGFGSLVLLLIGGVFMYAYYNTRPGPRIGFLIPGAILLGLGVGTALESLDS